jgi:spoIIIJ-associated protein
MNWQEFIKEMIQKMGFKDFVVDINEEHQNGSVFIHENENLIKENLLLLVENINKLIQFVAQRKKIKPVFLDINNYHKERERLIRELARSAAKKAIITKQEIPLPPMNSYERRIVHCELMSNPEVKTESEGSGKNRFVIIKPVFKEEK